VIAIAALLDPEAIVLGEGTSAAGPELLAAVRARVRDELWIERVLVLAALGEEAQLYGAIAGATARLDPDFVV
jgi:predicted NBD/HSP70 family sugar kinase